VAFNKINRLKNVQVAETRRPGDRMPVINSQNQLAALTELSEKRVVLPLDVGSQGSV
jgi:hypothetical protein